MAKRITAEVKTDTYSYTNFAGNALAISPTINDTTLFMFKFKELDPTSGLYIPKDLTVEGGVPQALRLLIRQDRDAASDLYSFQDAYNQGDDPSFESLPDGQVTFQSSWEAAAGTELGNNESMTAWIEVSFLDFNAIPVTLFTAQIIIVNELDDGAVGTPPPSSPTYLTAVEIQALAVQFSDIGFWPNVLDKDLTAPPGSPSLGDTYIVATGATGLWAAQDDKIAVWDSSWKFYAQAEGWTAWVSDEDAYYTYNSGWSTVILTSNFTNEDRLTSVNATGGLKESLIHDGVSAGILTLAKAGTTPRAWTFPDSTDTVVGNNTAATLASKTLTSPTINTPSITTPTITSGKLTMPAVAEIEAATSLKLDSPVSITGKVTLPAVAEIEAATSLELDSAVSITGKLTLPDVAEIKAATSLDLDTPFVGIDGATQSDAEKLRVSGDALVDGDLLVSADVLAAGDLYAAGAVFDAATELTIVSGSVTVEQALHSVDTESDAATDDLDTIVATNYPGLLLVRAAHADRTIVLKDGTGNLELGGADIELDAIDKFVILQWDTAETKWLIAGGSAIGVTDYIDFTTGLVNPAYLEGRRFYDNVQKCMASYNDKPDFTHQEGREVTARVKNMTGVPITNGQVVYISGPNAAAVPLVSLAKADSPSTANAIGIATTAIAHTEEGEVTIAGSVNDLDLSLYSENDIVWLSAANAGDFTDTAPGTPDIQVQLGTVSFAQDSTGSLLMDIRYFGVESDFAEVSIDDNTVATTINTVNEWEQVTTFTTDGLAQGAVPDYTNSHITANKTAAYDVSAFFSFSGSNNAKYEVALYKNDGASRLNTIIGRRQMNSTGDVGMGPIGGKVDLTAGDTVELWVRNITGDQDTTFEFCVMGITEIGNICGAAPLGNLDVDGLTMSNPLELTIDAGSVTPKRGLHRVDTESDVSADDLDTIVATEYSGLLMVRAEHTDRTVILKDGAGNLELGGTDITLDDTNRFVLLQYDPSQSKWLIAGDGGGGANPTESVVLAASDESTDLTTGTAKVTFRMPYAFTVTEVRASVNTAPVGSTIIVDINEGGTSILSTKLSIDASEKTSTTAATPPVISDSALADDSEITIDIDQIGSSTAGKGLKVTLIGTQV